MLSKVAKKRNRHALVLITPVLLSIWLTCLLTGSPSKYDDKDNVIYAFNIYHHNTFSKVAPDSGELLLSNYREPVLPYSIAAFFLISKPLRSASFDEVLESRPLQVILKWANVFWAYLLLLGYSLLFFRVSQNSVIYVISILALFLLYISDDYIVDRLFSEMAVSAILTWVSYLSLRCQMEGGKKGNWIALGVLLGLLCLTKAVFLYISIPYIVLFSLFLYIKHGGRRAILNAVTCLLLMIATVLPWVLRNYIYLDDFALTQRGGQVLHTRATKNEMNTTEILGSFFYYAPPDCREYVGHILGYGPADLMRGGRLQRLNRDRTADFHKDDFASQKQGKPDEVISFWWKSAARHTRVRVEVAKSGVPTALVQKEADKILKNEAMSYILSHPLKHTIMCVPFFYRGIGQVNGHPYLDTLAKYLPFLRPGIKIVIFTAFFICIAIELKTRKIFLSALLTMPLLVIVFYTIMTHNIPRYTEILMPYYILCTAYLLSNIVQYRSSQKLD